MRSGDGSLAARAARRAQRGVGATAIALLLTACPTDGPDPAPACSSGCGVCVPDTCPDPSLTYAKVQPILAAKCVVCHHDKQQDAWPMTSAQAVKDKRDEIHTVLQHCQMPPPEAKTPLSKAESQQILDWIGCGMPD